MDTIESVTREFAQRLQVVFHQQVIAALPGDVLKNGSAKTSTKAVKPSKEPAPIARKKPRKKPPIQLCPVPKCTGRAAPVFRMVCAKHKDTPKKLIAQYRAARKAKKK